MVELDGSLNRSACVKLEEGDPDIIYPLIDIKRREPYTWQNLKSPSKMGQSSLMLYI